VWSQQKRFLHARYMHAENNVQVPDMFSYIKQRVGYEAGVIIEAPYPIEIYSHCRTPKQALASCIYLSRYISTDYLDMPEKRRRNSMQNKDFAKSNNFTLVK